MTAAACAVVAACVAPTEESDVQSADITEQRYALVSIDAPAGRTTGTLANPVETAAHFVAYRGVSERTVAAALDAWEPVETEGCVVLEPPASAHGGATLDLLSAGSVGVSGNGGSVSYAPRFLGTGPRLSGFTYAVTEDLEAPTWAAGERYTFWASGDEIGPFAVTIDAPEWLALVAVSDRELGSATETWLDPREDVDVELFTESDEVFVTLRTLQPFGAPTAECRFGAIDGIRFDAAELDAAFGVGTDLELTVRTAASEPLPDGIGIEGHVLSTVYDRVIIRR